MDVDIRDGASMTSLMWAAFHGRTEQVCALLAKGADPSLRDMDGMTAAHWSIQRHDTRVLQVHIEVIMCGLHHSLCAYRNDILVDAHQF